MGKNPKTEIVSFFLSLLIFYAKSLKYLRMLGKVIFCQNGLPSDEQPTLFLVTSKTNECLSAFFLLQNLLLGLISTGRYKTIGLRITPKTFLKLSVQTGFLGI